MLSIFSFICWPSVCLLWKPLGLLSFFFFFREGNGTPVLLPGKSHGWRSLVGCSPCGCEESDTTERLHFHFSLSCFGEGNGNPLQCSCLENPRDGGAWWAAIYGVTQSWTWLKWLSSSSPIFYWVICFFMSYLYILEIKLSVASFPVIFSQAVGCLFCLWFPLLCKSFKFN